MAERKIEHPINSSSLVASKHFSQFGISVHRKEHAVPLGMHALRELVSSTLLD